MYPRVALGRLCDRVALSHFGCLGSLLLFGKRVPKHGVALVGLCSGVLLVWCLRLVLSGNSVLKHSVAMPGPQAVVYSLALVVPKRWQCFCTRVAHAMLPPPCSRGSHMPSHAHSPLASAHVHSARTCSHTGRTLSTSHDQNMLAIYSNRACFF